MSFYDYGQTVGDGSLGSLIKGGEAGLTFAQGVKAAMQKRKIDQQTEADRHEAAQQQVVINNSKYGISENPDYQDPTPKPGLMSRVGHALLGGLGLGGGEQHQATGQNVGPVNAPTADSGAAPAQGRFSVTGPSLEERLQTSQIGATKELNSMNNDAAYTRLMDETNSKNAEGLLETSNRDATELAIARGHDATSRANFNMSHGDASADRKMAVLQRQAANLRSTLNGGFLGGQTISPDDRKRLEDQYSAIIAQEEQVGGFAPHSLMTTGGAGDTEPNTAQPQTGGADPTFGVPQFFDGKFPPAGDPIWESVLRRHGKIPPAK